MKLTAKHLAAFRERPLVIVSPHFDDACFSLGCFLNRVAGGVLVNVFTRGDNLPRERNGADAQNPDRVHAIRDAEDRVFAQRCNLARRDLLCDEPSLLSRSWSDLSHVPRDVERMAAPLLTTLADIAWAWRDGPRGRLFTPLGIGRHANHRAIAEVVLGHIEELRRSYDVFLYEDLPYAFNPQRRNEALSRARAAHELALGERHTLSFPWQQKKALIELYASQFSRAPARFQFRPAAFSPLAIHEAFWSTGA